jgi:hypothetical protein
MSSNFQLKKVSFKLRNEINYLIEGLSVNLNENTCLKFIHDDRLPEIVEGDVDKFRLALITVIEFAMNYCNSGLIIVKSNHEGVTKNDRNTTIVGFSIVLSVDRSAYDEKVLFDLINKEN